MIRRSLRLPALLVAGVLALSACGGGGGSDDTPDSGATGGGTVTLGATLEPTSLDMTSQSGAAIPQVLLYNVYEGLVKIDPGTGEIVPLLAKDWEVSADGKTYTFHLQDATFHDGQPLTAQDVVWSFQRVTAEGSTNPFKRQMGVVQSVEAPDDKTVVVTLSRPSNNWLFDIGTQVGIVLKEGATDLESKPNGTGPFTFTDWNRGNSITLTRNDDYWGEKPAIDKAVFRYITDPNALNNAMLSGQLDILTNVQAPQLLKVFEGKDEFTVVEGQTTGEVVLGMNNSRSPLDKVEVRQAIRYAIDKKALVDTAWSGYGTLIGSMVPPSDPWYEDRTGDFPYDPEKAKQLLAQAGYPNGFSLTMDVPPPGYARASAQFVASQLAEVGITVTQNNIEFPQWLDKVFAQANYDLTIVSHVEPRDIGQYGNPDYYWRYNNPQVAQLLVEADTATDPDVRDAKYKEVAKQISLDAASDWLFLLPNLEVIRKGVTGFPKDALTLSFDLTNVQKSS
jgi:peptide/nickel transport system substrate-binding protein